ncbi:hypothetical protein P9B03_19985 [Metasolibacillus meyeri]|uniref:DUF4083 domain-containing protein n=1 Tax=Metasolibacillus meyeri TaxID=1071052 RepID=A0AAW9NSR3_9BACL|nr:hypothetical protein [Metasolibacillus meyeri]MEC1180737.1 hypothetical protein [Metasolibacillus meyeri]
MNGLIALLLALIPYVLLFGVAIVFFNLIFQIKRNSDIQIEQNKQLISLLEKKFEKKD